METEKWKIKWVCKQSPPKPSSLCPITDDDYEANTSTNWIKVISFVQGGCATAILPIHLIMNTQHKRIPCAPPLC